jgi:hypothetical protein
MLPVAAAAAVVMPLVVVLVMVVVLLGSWLLRVAGVTHTAAVTC